MVVRGIVGISARPQNCPHAAAGLLPAAAAVSKLIPRALIQSPGPDKPGKPAAGLVDSLPRFSGHENIGRVIDRLIHKGGDMAEDWQKLDSEKAGRVLKDINPHLEPVPFNPATTMVRSQALSFYRDYTLFELTDLSAVPGARKYALCKPGDVNIITWTNQPIYEVNEKAPVVLNENTVADYVRFFFGYVRGRHGRFLVIETIDDVRWQIEPPAQGRKVMQEMLEPVTLLGEDPDGTFNLEAFMVFKDSLFKTKIHVRRDGMVSMSEEELKIEGMPVLQDAVA